MKKLGSISSRFVSPRSLAHRMAGALVYPLYFWTNPSQACWNRAGLAVIGQFCHSFIQHGGKQCWWVFVCCKVCLRALFVSANQGKRSLSFTANGLRKIRNFSVFPAHLRCCVDEIWKPVWFTSCAGCALVILSLWPTRLCRTKLGSLLQSV